MRGLPLLATVATGAAAAVWGTLAQVEGAAAGAALATVLVVGFFSTGAVPLLLVGGDTSRAGLGFLVLMMTYVLRLVALLVVLTIASRSSAVDIGWLAGTLIVITLVRVVAQVALLGRSKAVL